MIPIIVEKQAHFSLETAVAEKPIAVRMQQLFTRKYGTALPVGGEMPKLRLEVLPELGDKDYRIDFSADIPLIAGGSEEALETAVNRFVAMACRQDCTIRQGTVIRYDYSLQQLDNRSMLPAYKSSVETVLESSDAEGMLKTPDWVSTLVLVEARLQTSSLARTFQQAVPMLDFYAKMGVNALWITPIYEEGAGGNGYGNVGLHSMEPKLTGTSDRGESRRIAREFVDAAHKRNIYILWDIISWGTVTAAPLFKEHPDWYNGKAWGNEAFNWKNGEFCEWFINHAVQLILETDADGFRCDCEPYHGGYRIYGEIRRRLAAAGKHIMQIAEDCNVRKDAFDMEQDGVLDYSKMTRGQLYENPVNFFADGLLDIVESCKTGRGLGPAELQGNAEKRGTFRFYPNCITNHDYQFRNVNGDRLKINYAAILAPFIPIWLQGDEIGMTSPKRQVLYFQDVDYSLADQPAHAFFMEDVKRALSIQRRFHGIFDRYPINHRDVAICKVTVEGLKGLTAYARYDAHRTVIVVPNPMFEEYGSYRVTLPFAMQRKVTDLLYDQGVSLCADGVSFDVVIPPRHIGVYLTE